MGDDLQQEPWKPAFYALSAFIISLALVWSFGDVFAVLLLDHNLPTTTFSSPAERQAEVLLLGFISALVGIVCYVVFVWYSFKRRAVGAAQRMVADLVMSTEQLQLLYDNSPVPYFVMDDMGHVRNANKATLRFFAASPEDFQVANLYSLVTGLESDATTNELPYLMSKIQRGVPISDEEVNFKTYNGDQRIARMSVYSLDHKPAMPYKHLVALQDMTKERASEQVKTDFLLLASHQLRTPTTTIKWYTDYLLDTKSVELPDTVREYLIEIYAANERMTDLVATLLTVSRIEMGTLAPEYTNVTVQHVVRDILQELKSDIEKKELQVREDVPETASVTTDQKMLRIAIHNLITNAVKYTPRKGEVSIGVTCSQSICTIEVHDNGCGVPTEEQDRIFSKMFRASNAKKVSANGTGLGLYLTRSFVEKLGGKIEFESQKNEGSTFTILLPRVAPGA